MEVDEIEEIEELDSEELPPSRGADAKESAAAAQSDARVEESATDVADIEEIKEEEVEEIKQSDAVEKETPIQDVNEDDVEDIEEVQSIEDVSGDEKESGQTEAMHSHRREEHPIEEVIDHEMS